MKRRLLSLLVLLALAPARMLYSTAELRSPLVLWRGTLHYPIPAEDDGTWVIDTWETAYVRSANKAFISTPCPKPCDSVSSVDDCNTTCTSGCPSLQEGGSTTETQSLAALFFGSPSFRGEQAFAGGFINNAVEESCTPALSFSRLSPSFTYNEYGLFLCAGFHVKLGKNKNYRVGMRGGMPFKVVNVQCDSCCQVEESFTNVVSERYNSAIDAGTNNKNEFAYRLDFLTSLCNQPSTDSLVTYDTNGVIIAGIQFNNANNGVFVVQRNDGTLPAAPYSKDAAAAELNASATNGSNNEVLSFGAQDYKNGGLATNRQAQSHLYVVPQTTSNVVSSNAQIVRNAVDSILNILDFTGRDSALQFFKDRCILLCQSQRTASLGDINTEFYGGYHPVDKPWYADIVWSIVWPTGPRNTNPKRVLFQTTGNNGHFEMRGGLEGGWSPLEWLALRAYAVGAHVFGRNEKRAALFEGETIRNIGPTIDVKIYYNYFWGNFDFNIFHPEDPNLGCTFGYELYVKGKDHAEKVCGSNSSCPSVPSCGPVDMCDTTQKVVNDKTADLLGRQQNVQYCLYRNGSNVVTHKLQGEFFKRWEYFELYGGASQIVAGKNAMKESEAHIGVALNF